MIALFAAAAVLTSAAVVATAAAPKPKPTKIRACASKANGALRIARKCSKKERRVEWSIVGATGRAGAPGAPGAGGAAGAAGAHGAVGPAGAKGDAGDAAPPARVYERLGLGAVPSALPAGPARTAIATQALPAGNWVINATAVLSGYVTSGAPRQITVTCGIDAPAGTRQDIARPVDIAVDGDGGRQAVVLSFATTAQLEAPGPVKLACTPPAAGTFAFFEERGGSGLVATEVGNVTRTQEVIQE